MPIQKNILKESIKQAFIAEMDKTNDPEISIDRISEAISEAVAVEIVRGVNTAVVALSNSAGPVTGTITASAI